MRIKGLVADGMIVGQVSLEEDTQGVRLSYKAGVDLRAWTGRPVDALPRFDSLSDFVERSTAASSVRIEGNIGDQDDFCLVPEKIWKGAIAAVGPRLRLIRAMRDAAKKLGLDVTLPDIDSMSPADLSDLVVTLESVNKGRSEFSGAGFTFNARIKRDAPLNASVVDT